MVTVTVSVFANGSNVLTNVLFPSPFGLSWSASPTPMPARNASTSSATPATSRPRRRLGGRRRGLTGVGDAAFHLYSRGASDYRP